MIFILHLHVSCGVLKLGRNIPSINLPPVETCRKDAPCFSKCYARKGRFAFPHNKELLQNNLQLWFTNPLVFEKEAVRAALPFRFLRWHSSGDIPSAAYLSMMVRVAQACPHTEFLCFTKKDDLINDYLRAAAQFPENLHVVLSAWGSLFTPSNPYSLPVAYVRFKNENSAIPASAFTCSGYCGECCTSGHSCWDLKIGESVVFNEH